MADRSFFYERKGCPLKHLFSFISIVEYHNKEFSEVERYRFISEIFGKKTRFIDVIEKHVIPIGKITQFIMDNELGEIYKKELMTLMYFYNRELSVPDIHDSYEKIIISFLSIDIPGQSIISSVKEIPEYAKHKLDPDLESLIRPMAIIEDTQDTLVYVVFTYQQMGGSVRRYRFPFIREKRIGCPVSIVSGEGIGKALYLK